MTKDYEQFVQDCLKPFEAWQIEKLPKGGLQLDYVSHAHVTQRLLELDPFYTWEFVAQNPANGLPVYDDNGGLWIRLTVCGVSRYGYGEPSGGTNPNDKVKSAIGDAIRNAAMRFGIALSLWQNDKPANDQLTQLKNLLAKQGATDAPTALKIFNDLMGTEITTFEQLRLDQIAAATVKLRGKK